MGRFPAVQYRKSSDASMVSSHREPSLTLDEYYDKQHRCTLCFKQFSRASILRDHIRRHEKEKPFLCGTCSKAFASKSDLKRHEDVHAGRKFACDRCGKQFTRRLAIAKHICTRSNTRDAAINTITQSIEQDPSFQYILPANAPGNASNFPLGVSLHLYPGQTQLARPSEHSLRRTIPLPTTIDVEDSIPDDHLNSDKEDEDIDHVLGDMHDNASNSDSDMSSSSAGSDRTSTPPLPVWEEYTHQCGICPAQYFSSTPLARHLVHHLEEMDLRPYRCNTCKISFAFHEELAKHEIYDQREQHEDPSGLSLPCIWNCGKVFTSGDKCREHVGKGVDGELGCRVGMALEGQSRDMVLRQFRELVGDGKKEVSRTIQKLIDKSLAWYKGKTFDIEWFMRLVAELDDADGSDPRAGDARLMARSEKTRDWVSSVGGALVPSPEWDFRRLGQDNNR
ncbi:hypothetical protein K504DRAFT_530963 [Pleomassaria siparia CBS 279.74]|uniref:C2H2-type domain-containing protein n=1 Tax=Pleomassaria siparia CBS 279.74 TaxID=1314801 RepID=A0A6G1KNZ1_9PLEO|nr:hypothetical protein K504DRAFT_530963 [Pleomassaria siparia CBS 279.74]